MNFWYEKSLLAYLLLPFAALFWLISTIRRQLFRAGILTSYRAPVPVIVVGNISVGGNGKTPVVVWLVRQLRARGLKCGVISRGYGNKAGHYPLLVDAQTDPVRGGDEPVLIAGRTGVPVCVSPNRQAAIELLLKEYTCDVVISDDGLQHYKLRRDLEIIVTDAQRGLGNGFMLPAGPLRELPSRFNSVDLIITNGGKNQCSDAVMRLVPYYAVNLVTREKRSLNEFTRVSALAGIGNPQRFFSMLQGLGMVLTQSQGFQDHQRFSAELLSRFDADEPLLMTEKDAVKCTAFARSNWWYVPVDAEISGRNLSAFLAKIERLCHQKKHKN